MLKEIDLIYKVKAAILVDEYDKLLQSLVFDENLDDDYNVEVKKE